MYGSRNQCAETDGLDQRLLEALRRNSRESFVELAKRLGTSEGTVRARLRRLTESGAIRTFTIRTAIMNVKAMINVKVDTNVNTSDIVPDIENRGRGMSMGGLGRLGHRGDSRDDVHLGAERDNRADKEGSQDPVDPDEIDSQADVE